MIVVLYEEFFDTDLLLRLYSHMFLKLVEIPALVNNLILAVILLNQRIHIALRHRGDREYGHIVSRMGIERKIIVGHWASESVL